jgi:hypothetical protein
VNVLLSGEGPDDIGDWAKERPYRATPPEIGVIEALLRTIYGAEFTVRDALPWKKISKFRAGDHARPETRNVLGLALRAEELGCNALVFVRDRDRDPEREADIEAGLRRARDLGLKPAIAGGVAIEELEAWLLAILGERGSERHPDAKAVLKEKHGIVGRAAMIATIKENGTGKVPEDAASLRLFFARASVALSPGGG